MMKNQKNLFRELKKRNDNQGGMISYLTNNAGFDVIRNKDDVICKLERQLKAFGTIRVWSFFKRLKFLFFGARVM